MMTGCSIGSATKYRKSKIRLLAYVRVSTKRQGELGHSLEAQHEFIDHYIKARDDLTLVDTLRDDGFSGGLPPKRRPNLNRGLQMLAQKEADGLIFLKLDRLTRSLKDLLKLIDDAQKQNWHLLSIHESIDTTTPMGLFQLNIMGAVAELERGQISTRVRTSFSTMVPKMYAVARHAPYGYRFEIGGHVITKELAEKRDKKTPWRLLTDDEEACIMSTMIKLTLRKRNPLTSHHAAMRLNQLGHRTRAKKLFTAALVRSIMTTHVRRMSRIQSAEILIRERNK